MLQRFGAHGVQNAAVNVVEEHAGNTYDVAANQHLVLLHVAQEKEERNDRQGDEKKLENG
jgi:hypothetical protein